MKVIKAVRYEILRAITTSGTIWLPMPEKPVRIATLLDERAFLADQLLTHNAAVFLEDRSHDWNWRNGRFSYYTRVAKRADVVVVYEIEMVEVQPASLRYASPGDRKPHQESLP